MLQETSPLNLALPKGRIFDGVRELLRDAGVRIQSDPRSYRPKISVPGWDAKLLKPRSVAEMLHRGTRDIGFTGADWVCERECELIELVDTKLDPVRLVAAAPRALLIQGRLPERALTVATEYPNLTKSWLRARALGDRVIPTCGATEVYPPEDADFIVDNTSTGATLRANDLSVFDEVMRSSTRLFASPGAMQDPGKRREIEHLVRLVRSVLEARARVMLEMNVRRGPDLEGLMRVLPSMGQPTVSSLHGGGYAVKAAILRKELPSLIPLMLSCGASDLVTTSLEQIVVETCPS